MIVATAPSILLSFRAFPGSPFAQVQSRVYFNGLEFQYGKSGQEEVTVYQISETAMAPAAGKTATICLLGSLALLFPSTARADAVTTWNAKAGKAALASCIAP